MQAVADAARAVMALYPRIYFACHTRHVRDPQSGRLLSRHQASVLDHLDEIEPTTLNDLARHMGVTAATMSLTIDRLERKGYVIRLRDTADRRRVHLRLTGAGVRVRQASSVLDPARVEAMVARLADADREAAVRGLALLARAAAEQMGSVSARREDASGQAAPSSGETGGAAVRWILYAVVVLAALAVIAAVIGAALPKAHVASVTAQLAAPPDEVWRTITEVERFPEWRHGVTRVERIADQHGRTSWAEHSSEGRIPFVVERREPPRVLVVRIADASLPFGGTWTYEIVPEASGSTITITENGEVYNPIFRLVAKFVFGHDRTLRQYADSLGARLGSKERTHGV